MTAGREGIVFGHKALLLSAAACCFWHELTAQVYVGTDVQVAAIELRI
jgi:hypothetical protein